MEYELVEIYENKSEIKEEVNPKKEEISDSKPTEAYLKLKSKYDNVEADANDFFIDKDGFAVFQREVSLHGDSNKRELMNKTLDYLSKNYHIEDKKRNYLLNSLSLDLHIGERFDICGDARIYDFYGTISIFNFKLRNNKAFIEIKYCLFKKQEYHLGLPRHFAVKIAFVYPFGERKYCFSEFDGYPLLRQTKHILNEIEKILTN